MSDYRTILFELSDNVATITFNRADRMNALIPTVFAEMVDAMDKAVGDGARALIITAAGRAFCSGADLIDEDGNFGLPEDVGGLLDESYNPGLRKMADYPLPIITALNGPAVGAGVGVALSGDIVIAARSAFLLMAFVNVGLVPDAGSSWFVARGVGRAKALEMALLGEKLSADDAKAAGLIARVVDDADLMAEARKIAIRLANGPTMAIRMMRKQVASALTLTLSETLDLEAANQTVAGRTRDCAEGVAAFIEKRKPIFEGH
ncbi:short chain enoyl-CoA hydratase /Enoyl-CoA hydratase [Sphingomonas sp. YR710]|uniref:enoyl-CoA hydratase-related protein n=1 Tax=Sphingomonas sp. YR710 TaxID=1882773 RepID=UPI00088CA0A2|nr:enoyl-CoA hydratase-related protein [Sphingomonas sp. YR710]SDC24016.1 short chain enoyl-CoA hydratase /Enoyl-CoA hydratase [Sphingomonas sp. YR710]